MSKMEIKLTGLSYFDKCKTIIDLLSIGKPFDDMSPGERKVYAIILTLHNEGKEIKPYISADEASKYGVGKLSFIKHLYTFKNKGLVNDSNVPKYLIGKYTNILFDFS